jgi:hypothetical protein
MAHQDLSVTGPDQHSNHRLKPALLLLLASLAGLISWAIAERTGNIATVPPEIAAKNYQFKELNAATIRMNSINGALTYGGLGAITCIAISCSILVAAKRQTRQITQSALISAILGFIAGSLPCLIVMPMHWMNRNNDPSVLDLTRPLLYHLGLWLPIGMAAGLMHGIHCRLKGSALIQSVMTGLLGALFGTFFYEFAGAILLPMDLTVDPVPATVKARLLAHLSIPIGIAFGLILAHSRKPKISPESVG